MMRKGRGREEEEKADNDYKMGRRLNKGKERRLMRKEEREKSGERES